MPQEKYPEKCPWDLGPKQNLAKREYWILANGAETVRFIRDEEDHHWFNLIYNDEIREKVLHYKARLIYQKLLDKGYKLLKK